MAKLFKYRCIKCGTLHATDREDPRRRKHGEPCPLKDHLSPTGEDGALVLKPEIAAEYLECDGCGTTAVSDFELVAVNEVPTTDPRLSKAAARRAERLAILKPSKKSA